MIIIVVEPIKIIFTTVYVFTASHIFQFIWLNSKYLDSTHKTGCLSFTMCSHLSYLFRVCVYLYTKFYGAHVNINDDYLFRKSLFRQNSKKKTKPSSELKAHSIFKKKKINHQFQSSLKTKKLYRIKHNTLAPMFLLESRRQRSKSEWNRK
jgi:hypothetical protein